MSSTGLPNYAPLWCKSNYSFLEGASHPEELVEECQRLGMRSLVLTDRDGVYGAVRGHMKARELGVHLVLGAQITIDDGSSILLLVMNREGYANLCGLISKGRLRCAKGQSEVTWVEVCEHEEGLIALWGGEGSLLVREPDPLFIARDLLAAFGDRLYALLTRHRQANEPVVEARVRDRAERYGLPTVAGQEILYHAPSRRPLQDVVTCLRSGVTLATAGTSTKPNAEHALKPPHAFALLFEDDLYSVARTLEVVSRCTFTLDEIRYRYPSEQLPDGTTSSEWLRHLTYDGAKKRYFGEWATAESPSEPLEAASDAEPDALRGQASGATESAVTESVGPDYGRPGGTSWGDLRTNMYLVEGMSNSGAPSGPSPFLPSEFESGPDESLDNPTAEQVDLTMQPHSCIPLSVVAQLDKELALIAELEYDGYFLTMWEVVQFCRREGILCQGRGSAANSAVCFCLGITAIDPVRMGLLFERFLSKERAEPPDIDLDIEHDRREEVIQWVYQKYGRTHAGMVANFVRFRTRSAVRELGKVLGFAETEIDRLAKLMPNYGSINSDALRQAGFDAEHPMHQQLLALTLEIQDFPRHLSIHPGGFLLGHEPIDRLVPLENATMADRTVIQWDKEDLENLELFKIDLLGLGALRQLHLSFDLLRQHWGRELSMAEIPPDDEPTFRLMHEGDTVGVFQIESRAQMAMLPRLRPVTYYDLVIEVSIVRPGPISGGMVHPYLRRRNGEEDVTYPHPSLEPVLKKTLGIPLFQEQVMKLAVVAADYTPGEADRLRRDMAAWRSSGRMERHRERLIQRMKAKGIAVEFAERVFEQIRGFGEYGFPESHAASFALIAYATSWLRCHYIDVFTCALLNAQPMGFYTPATIIEDAKRHGLTVLPVDVAQSDWDCTLQKEGSAENRVKQLAVGLTKDSESELSARLDPKAFVDSPQFAVRLGLRYVKGIGKREREQIEAARKDGAFQSIEDFARRTGLEKQELNRLAEAGAFETFERHRRQAVWKVRAIHRTDRPSLDLYNESAKRKSRALSGEPFFPTLSDFETIAWDYESSHLSARGHPLEPLRAELQDIGLPDAKKVNGLAHGAQVRFAGLAINRQRPGTAGGVTFMTLEDESGFINLVIWESVFAQYRMVVKRALFLGVTGKLQVASGVVHLVAEEFWVPELTAEPRSAGSRDFH